MPSQPSALHLRTFTLTLAAAVLLIGPATPAVRAQLKGKPAERPLLIGYMRDIGPKEVTDYLNSLAERLKIGESFRSTITSQIVEERNQNLFPKTDEPLYGVAVYLVSGLIPTFETISFQKVIDEADARRLVEGRKSQFGDQGTVHEIGDGCFKYVYRSSSEFELPPGADESTYANLNNTQQPRGLQMQYEVREKDGKKVVSYTFTMTTYIRYADGLLFEANFEELLTMSLPTGDDVSSAINDANDLAFAAYLDRVPAGIRMLSWNMLTSAIATQLQQRDGEPDIDYNARRSAGDLGLALTKSVLFDIDHSDGWLRLASEDDPALRGELRVRARTNSELSKQLLETAGVSRFAPILRDDAAVTFHLCARLPGEAPPALDAAANWLRDAARRKSADNPAAIAMADAAATAIQAFGQQGTVELLFKTGWTPASGGVFYGGLQLPEQPGLLDSMQRLIMTLHGAPANLAVIVPAAAEDEFRMLQINVPQEFVEQIRRESGMTISHIWMAQEYGCLWFAAGVESSREIIRQSVARCREAGRAIRTPLVSAGVDMERWLSWPQDDPAGIAQLPWYLDENAWWFPQGPVTAMATPMIDSASVKPVPIMQRVYDLGGGQQFWLTVDTDERGILVQSELGLALANHMAARIIDLQDRIIQEVQSRSQEAMRAAEEASKAADPATQPGDGAAADSTVPAGSP